MRYRTLQYGVEDDVVTVALARPEVSNALDAQMKSDLAHALGRAAGDGRVVVLTGLGPAFCAGQDLGDAPNLRDVDLGRVQREETGPLLAALADCAAPVLAAVNGPAAGAGLALALAADVAVAAESVAFSLPNARIGLPPDSGLSWLLTRAVGPARARGMALLAGTVDARTAAAWGLIWEAAPDARFAETVAARARMLADGPTAALVAARRLLREAAARDFDAQLEAEAEAAAEAGRGADFLEGVVARAEGRRPRFTGR